MSITSEDIDGLNRHFNTAGIKIKVEFEFKPPHEDKTYYILVILPENYVVRLQIRDYTNRTIESVLDEILDSVFTGQKKKTSLVTKGSEDNSSTVSGDTSFTSVIGGQIL